MNEKDLEELEKDFHVSGIKDKEGNIVVLNLWAKEIYITDSDQFEKDKIANKHW